MGPDWKSQRGDVLSEWCEEGMRLLKLRTYMLGKEGNIKY